MDIALRIRTDLGGAPQEVTQLDTAVDKLGAAGKQASTGLGALNTATDKGTAAHRQHAAAAKADAASLTDIEQKAKRAGISVGQYGMAMRMLPAQMTDISVGLATGQSPFMVLMQQGGQLKDSFGGIVPAARAVGGSIMGLVNPYTLAAAAVAGLGLLVVKQQNELAAYNQALILTGGYAGRSAAQLQAMADSLEGVSHGNATEALAEVAASGRFTGEAFDQVSEAAARMKEAVGREVDDTISTFKAIQDDPVKALLKLNETEHFLTSAQLDRVQALISEGNEQQAVAEATRIYSDQLLDVADRAEAARTPIERLWASAKRGASDAAAEASSFANWMALGAMQQGERDAQAPWYQRAKYMVPGYGAYASLKALTGATPEPVQDSPAPAADVVESKAETAKLEEQKKRAREREAFLAAEVRYLDESAKKKREIAAVDDQVTRGVINQEEATKRIAQIEADYAEKAKKRGTEKKTDAQRAEEDAQRELENLRKQTDMLGLVEDGERRVSEEARIRWEIENGAHKAASAATQQQLIAQAQALDAARKQREEQEKQRKETEDATRAYERLQDRLRTPVEAAVDDVTAQIEVLNAALAKGLIDAEKYKEELAKVGDRAMTPLPDFRAELYQYGIGDPEADRMGDMHAELQAGYERRRAIINAELEKENADREYWNEKSVELERQHQQALSNLAIAESQMRMMQMSGAFNSMAQMARAFGDEQSRTYQVLFAISKGFAVAQAAVALAQNVAEASKAGFPANIGLIAAALAQGAQIASLLSQANYSPAGYAGGGRITGPGTGTSDDVPLWGSAGEFMVRYAAASQPGGYAFLEDFNQRGMAALEDWRGYAEGGVITSAAEPRGQFYAGGGRGTPVSLQNAMRLYLYQDMDALRSAILNHPETEKKMVATIGENRGPVEASWSY
ncbi:MAG: phage tail length tape measure family protein [Stenotrophomonas sp.]